MPAVALTDQSNLFAMVKFYRAAQAAGVKPIIGVDLRVREPGERSEPSTLVLLCQNEIGYRNLTRLVSRSYLEGQQRGLATIERALARCRQSRRADCAVGRAATATVGRALVTRPRRRGAQGTGQLAGAVRRSLLHRVAADAARRRGTLHPRRARPRRRIRRAGRGDQRRALHPRGRLRLARGARVHSRRRAGRRCRSGAVATAKSSI